MGKKVKKGSSGTAAKYIVRAAALRKLQLSLADFRRLCILKGIYPRDPKKKLKGRDKTYYHVKDIHYLYNEPLLSKSRDQKAHDKKLRRALGRHDLSTAQSLQERRPRATLFHLVKERYPTFIECFRDLDDALSTLALFASLPVDHSRDIKAEVIAEATRLLDEFLLLVVKAGLLWKVFCSIKGYYIQIKYLGQLVTFLLPHQFSQDLPPDVDFKVLLTFLEFYSCMLRSVNFKMYLMEGYTYPPECNARMLRDGYRFLALSCTKIPRGAAADAETNTEKEDEEGGEGAAKAAPPSADVSSEEDLRCRKLFANLGFFLKPEIPKVPISLMLCACGADVIGWEDCRKWISRENPGERDSAAAASMEVRDIRDPRLTHCISDRGVPIGEEEGVGLENVQPQWVFDSINNRQCMPVAPYLPGKEAPPHLSPFDKEFHPAWLGADAQSRAAAAAAAASDDEESEESSEDEVDGKHPAEAAANHRTSDEEAEEVTDLSSLKVPSLKKKAGVVEETAKKSKTSGKKGMSEEERARREALMSKKHRRLLQKINFSKEREKEKSRRLAEKRARAKESLKA